jgi:hypothetical protein
MLINVKVKQIYEDNDSFMLSTIVLKHLFNKKDEFYDKEVVVNCIPDVEVFPPIR